MLKSIKLLEMLEEVDYSRRDFLGALTMGLAATKIGVFGPIGTRFGNTTRTGTTTIPLRANSLSALKQIDAGVLNVGYAEAGPGDGPIVV